MEHEQIIGQHAGDMGARPAQAIDVAFGEQLVEGVEHCALYSAGGATRARSASPDEPPPALLQLRAGRAESPGWFLIQAAEFDPEPLTVENLRARCCSS